MPQSRCKPSATGRHPQRPTPKALHTYICSALAPPAAHLQTTQNTQEIDAHALAPQPRNTPPGHLFLITFCPAKKHRLALRHIPGRLPEDFVTQGIKPAVAAKPSKTPPPSYCSDCASPCMIDLLFGIYPSDHEDLSPKKSRRKPFPSWGPCPDGGHGKQAGADGFPTPQRKPACRFDSYLEIRK